MKKTPFSTGAALLLCAALTLPLAVQAQNIAIVNGKAVPKARADALIKQVQGQAAAQGQQLPPDIEQRVRDKLVLDEIFAQEAEKRGLAATPEYKSQMEQARQAVLTQALLANYVKANPVSEADVKVEYDKFKAQSAGTEYRARHILVEKEDEAKALIAQIKAGGNFEELAKKSSKDPGSFEFFFASSSKLAPPLICAISALASSSFSTRMWRARYSVPADWPLNLSYSALSSVSLTACDLE